MCRDFGGKKTGQCAGIWSRADISTPYPRLGIILRAQGKATPKREEMDRGKENEQGKNNLPWQHLESNPIEREFHDELPPRHTQSGPDTGEAGRSLRRYCSCSCAVTPECGAWRRAGGLCSFTREEGKPQSPAQSAPAHMKRERTREREGE